MLFTNFKYNLVKKKKKFQYETLQPDYQTAKERERIYVLLFGTVNTWIYQKLPKIHCRVWCLVH